MIETNTMKKEMAFWQRTVVLTHGFSKVIFAVFIRRNKSHLTRKEKLKSRSIKCKKKKKRKHHANIILDLDPWDVVTLLTVHRS